MCNCEDRPCCGCGDDTGATIGADVSEYEGEMLRPCARCHETDCECDEDKPALLPGEDMDGDHDSAMASAGHGTDEDYGFFGEMGCNED